jgi:predicted choloylglycine hydrolase
MEDLIERESGKDLEILPFSIQHVRDVLYQKVEDNLAAIAAIVRGIGGAAVS